MKIKNNTSNFYMNKNTAFKRAPKPDINVYWNNKPETEEYPKSISDAKKFLGIKDLALILHQSSFPVKNDDIFIGSHINSKALELNKFLKFHGFDSIQIGPPGLTKRSPYQSSVNSKNYLYTDFEKFETSNYAKILSKNDIHKTVSKFSKNKNYEDMSDQTNFVKAFLVADKLFNTAYENLNRLVEESDPDAVKLKNEFEKFKSENADWLEKDAVFSELKNIFKTDDNFFKWPDIYANLFEYIENPNSQKHQKALNTYSHLKETNGKNLELYKFKQFIIDKQEHEFKNTNGKLKYTTDAIIGFHMMDYYSHKDSFLPYYRVGTPYGGEGKAIGNGSPQGENQTWDIPVVNPKKLFIKNKQGEIIGLGPAGKLIKQKFEKLLDTYENIRIDHAIGLIDPWIYDRRKVETLKGLYPYETNETPVHVIYKNAHGANISMMHKNNVFGYDKGWDRDITDKINKEIKDMPDIDPDGDYAKILDEILLPLFKEKGANPEDMAWETLGCDTPKFREVFDKTRDGKNLPEITSAYQWQIEKRLSNPRHKEDTVILGCHDHPPFAQVCDDKFYAEKNCPNGIYEENYIVGALYPEISSDERKNIMNQLRWDRRLRVKLKFSEMMRYAQKIQLTFMDFFGLDKTYNVAGTKNKQNWKLRLKKSYQEDYYKALEWKPGDDGVYKIALNMPEILKRSVIAKIQTEKNGDFPKYQELIDRLDYFENVLKTPEKD